MVFSPSERDCSSVVPPCCHKSCQQTFSSMDTLYRVTGPARINNSIILILVFYILSFFFFPLGNKVIQFIKAELENRKCIWNINYTDLENLRQLSPLNVQNTEKQLLICRKWITFLFLEGYRHSLCDIILSNKEKNWPVLWLGVFLLLSVCSTA